MTLELIDFLNWSEQQKSQVIDFATIWVTGDEEHAREHFADHASGDGTTLIAYIDASIVGLVTIRWKSNNPSFANRGIPLMHQLSVDAEHQRQGIGNYLMTASEQLAIERGIGTIGTTVGLFDEHRISQSLVSPKAAFVPLPTSKRLAVATPPSLLTIALN